MQQRHLAGVASRLRGTLFGVLIIGVIQTILVFDSRLSSWWTRIVIGVRLLVFVLLPHVFSRGRKPGVSMTLRFTI